MDFCSWIRSVGGYKKAAVFLKEKPRTVYAWSRLEKAPRLTSALNIVSMTAGVVDYNGIYGPYAAARVKGEVGHAQCLSL